MAEKSAARTAAGEPTTDQAHTEGDWATFPDCCRRHRADHDKEIARIGRQRQTDAANLGAEPDPQLTAIVGKYRALCTAMQRFDQLRREVAELYVELSEDQKRTYGEVVERIEIEDREGS